MKYLKFMNRYLGKYKLHVILIGVFTVLYSLLTLVSPLVVSYVIDNIIGNQPINGGWQEILTRLIDGRSFIRSNLWVGAIIIIAVTLLTAIVIWMRGNVTAVASERFTENLRNELYNHLQKLPYAYHVKSQSGDLIQRATSDVDQIRRFIANQIREFVYAVAIAVIASIILVSIHAGMAMIVFGIMPLIILMSLFFFKRMQNEFKKSDDAEGALSAAVQENLHGTRVVKAFNREAFELERFEAKNTDYRKKTLNVTKQLAYYWGFSDLICYCGILAVILFGILETQHGNLTFGNFFVFLSYITMVLWPVRNLGRVLSDLGKVTVSISRLQEVFDVQEEDLSSGIEPGIEGKLVFKNVSFKYDDGDHNVLNDVSFAVEKGETVALMGPTGSGKSSLVYLLTRLYDYQSGSIELDGFELNQIQRHYLRRHVGLVLQEPFLFSKSIYENIKIASPTAQEDDIFNAARKSEVHQVITDFDLGYQTLVGEKGVTLSGGQKQRIAIARTIINSTPILIFDDSLSAVDTETDASIRAHLQQLNQATTFIITHRVSTAQHADKIIVLDHGRIVQSGTHQELLNQEGLYQRIADIQSQIDLGEDYSNESE